MSRTIAALAGSVILVGALVAPAGAAMADGAATPASTAAMLVSVTEHSNVVGLGANEALPVSFTWDGGYSVTSGQPWDGVSTSQGSQVGGGVTIDVQAGRKGSTGPADWFNQRTSAPIGDDSSWDTSPSELNFAISGTLTIDGTDYPIVIGQGHSGDSNNWWIGGQGSGWTTSISTFGGADPTLHTITPDGAYAITCFYGFDNQFGVLDASQVN